MTLVEKIDKIEAGDIETIRDWTEDDTVCHGELSRHALRGLLRAYDALLASRQFGICSYCGHETTRGKDTIEQFKSRIRDHVLECDQRPERKMAAVFVKLGAELDLSFSDIVGEGPDAIAEAFLGAIRKLKEVW